MKIFLAIGTIALSAAAAASQAPEISVEAPKICKSSADIGSRLARTKTCLTQAEWDVRQFEARGTLDRAQTKQVNLTIDEKGRIDGHGRTVR